MMHKILWILYIRLNKYKDGNLIDPEQPVPD